MKDVNNQRKPSSYYVLPDTFWIIVLIALIVGLTACATVPHTGRRQFRMVSDESVNAAAMKAFYEVLSKEPESQDLLLKKKVQAVADRISKAAETVDKPGFQWEVRLIDKDIPNAFCLPGGKIVVYKGILPYVKNEAGLAAVIAHEVAHAVARHGAERLSQQVALKGAITLGGKMLKNEDDSIDPKYRLLLGAMGMGGTIGVILPYSRVHEFEADRIGQIYMAAAGYDPSEAARLWDRMSQIKKPPIPIWLSTHPADSDRVEKLREFQPQAEKYYQKATPKFGIGDEIK